MQRKENSFIKRKKEVGRTVENNEPKAFLWLSPCQERRGEVNKKLHRRWGGWLRNVECDENSGKCLLHQVQKWLNGSRIIFSVALTKRAAAVMALRQGWYPHPTKSSWWLLCPVGQCWSLSSGVSTPRAFPSFPYKREKRESDH